MPVPHFTLKIKNAFEVQPVRWNAEQTLIQFYGDYGIKVVYAKIMYVKLHYLYATAQSFVSDY